MPLFNILVAGADTPPFVQKVHDFTKELSKGLNKTGGLIADKCLEVMLELDPDKILFDCCFFDGASNVQKAGELLSQKYPQLSVFHGAEHVVSLFFNDLFKEIPVMKTFVQNYQLLYKYFGMGSSHKIYAVFSKYAEESNKGIKIGLIRAAETRMGGYWYCFLWLLRLRSALIQTTYCAEWNNIPQKSLSREVKTFIKELCCSKSFFEALQMIVASTFPVIKLLRLSDQNEAGMDKLYFATQKCTNLLRKNAKKLSAAIDKFSQDDMLGLGAKITLKQVTVKHWITVTFLTMKYLFQRVRNLSQIQSLDVGTIVRKNLCTTLQLLVG